MSEPTSESAIDELPQGATSRSFQVFAEWMKENRRMLTEQITGLAIRFEEIDRENKRRLDAIVDQTTRTNGRVTDLEQQRKLTVALDSGHSQWEHDRHEAEEAKRGVREKRLDRLERVGLILFGLAAGSFGHKFGLS